MKGAQVTYTRMHTVVLACLVALVGVLSVANGLWYSRGMCNSAQSYDEALNSIPLSFGQGLPLSHGHTPLYAVQSYFIGSCHSCPVKVWAGYKFRDN